MNPFYTLLHSDNRMKVITVLVSIAVLLGDYTGTLPAILERHRDWIELAAYLAGGLSLLYIDPKRSLHE